MAIKCVLRGILGSLPTMSRNIALSNTSITEIGFMPSKGAAGSSSNGAAHVDSSRGPAYAGSSRGAWHVLRVNDTAHLPLDLHNPLT